MLRTSYLEESAAAISAHESSHAASYAAMRGRIGKVQSALQYARGGLPPRARSRVHDYIITHLHEKITNGALAQIVRLSVYHFAKVFKQTEGISPHRYVLQCRVKRVQELLADTDMPLSEIAIAAGFSDQSHCTRCFREIVGVTPSSYRWSTR